MAEVLAEHLPIYRWSPIYEENVWSCSSGLCGVLGDLSKVIDHQAAELSAAGFGDERETAERVWDECERAQYVISLNPKGTAWEAIKTNPYRAAAVRGEG
jgi:hypothetical protein